MNLEELVHNFRTAIDRAKWNEESSYYFREFPTGQCGTTSDILCQYLIDKGFSNIEYANGTYYSDDPKNWQSHTWLVVKGTVVDITADQFKHANPPLKCDIPVYVGPITDYYRLFEIRPGSQHLHYGISKEWSNYRELKTDYETILKYL